MRTALVVGRDAELALIDEFLTLVAGSSASLVLEGAAGIGKTTVWQEALRRAEGRGLRVLSSRPGSSETRLTFVGLSDLLATVEQDVLRELPPPQRRALDVALLRSDDEGPAPEQRVVATAFLSVLRLLSGRAPVWSRSTTCNGSTRPRATCSSSRYAGSIRNRFGFLGAVRLGGAGRGVAGEWRDRIRLRPLNLAELHEIVKSELGRTFAHAACPDDDRGRQADHELRAREVRHQVQYVKR